MDNAWKKWLDSDDISEFRAAANDASKNLKILYDAYVSAGFTQDQAIVIIASLNSSMMTLGLGGENNGT